MASRRLRVASWHLAATCALVGTVSLVVFGIWFPTPFAYLAGGAQLMLLVALVDVVLGPTLTAVVANEQKRSRELVLDVVMIATVQAIAMAYGVYAAYQARPVGVVFEADLFRLVAAADVDAATLHEAPQGLGSLSAKGPRWMAAEIPSSADEQLRTIQLAMAGVPLAHLPRHWRDYRALQARAWERARPITQDDYWSEPEFLRLVESAGVRPEKVRTLPLMARRMEGTVVLAHQGTIVGVVPVARAP